MAALILDMRPDAMASSAALGRVALAAPQAPAPRRVGKTGRKDLCPCGSGKKFKSFPSHRTFATSTT